MPRDVKSSAAPKPAAAPSWLRPAILALTLLLLLTCFTGEIADTDIWLHLMTGRYTLNAHALTVPDPFSYTSNRGSASSGATPYLSSSRPFGPWAISEKDCVATAPTPDSTQFQLNVQTTGRLTTPDEFAAIVIRANPDGSFVRVRDVGVANSRA